jgi:hypothetical protein
VVAAVTVLIVAALAAVVYLSATGKDVQPVILILSSLIAPTIASFVAIRKLSDVAGKVDGKVDNLITDKSHLEQQVVAAGMTPVTARVSFDPVSTGPIPKIRAGTDTEEMEIPPLHTGQIPAADLIRREHPDYQDGNDHG